MNMEGKSISELRQLATNINSAVKSKEETIKSLDKDMRTIRGEVGKLKQQERQIRAQITKLSKEEL